MKWLIVLFFSTSIVYAQQKIVRPFDINADESYEEFVPDYRPELKNYLLNLMDSGSVKNNTFFHINISEQLSLTPAAILATLPERVMNCELVYCKDIDLQKRINQEISGGRLFLITHAYSGVNGAAVDFKDSITQQVFEDLGQKKSSNKSLFVITPTTTLDVMDHELKHGDDHADAKLKELLDELENLITGGDKTCNQSLKYHSRKYVLETRAYIEQENYLMSHARDYEYVLDENKMLVHEVSKEEFLKQKMKEIAIKKDIYQGRVDNALSKSILKEDVAVDIKNIMKAAIALGKQ